MTITKHDQSIVIYYLMTIYFCMPYIKPMHLNQTRKSVTHLSFPESGKYAFFGTCGTQIGQMRLHARMFHFGTREFVRFPNWKSRVVLVYFPNERERYI